MTFKGNNGSTLAKSILKYLNVCWLMKRVTSETPKNLKELLLFPVALAWALFLILFCSAVISIAVFFLPSLGSVAVLVGLGTFLTSLAVASVSKHYYERYKRIAGKAATFVVFFLLAFFIFAVDCALFGDIEVLEAIARNVEFPLARLGGIAIDDQGRVYCGIRAYSRVQVYDANGRFLRGWHAPIEKGPLHIEIGENGLIRVAIGHAEIFYDTNGNVQYRKQTTLSDFGREFGTSADLGAQDRHGDSYVIDGFPFARIMKYSTSGEESVLISDPLGRQLVRLPLPAIGLLIILFVADFALFGKKQRR